MKMVVVVIVVVVLGVVNEVWYGGMVVEVRKVGISGDKGGWCYGKG